MREVRREKGSQGERRGVILTKRLRSKTSGGYFKRISALKGSRPEAAGPGGNENEISEQIAFSARHFSTLQPRSAKIFIS